MTSDFSDTAVNSRRHGIIPLSIGRKEGRAGRGWGAGRTEERARVSEEGREGLSYPGTSGGALSPPAPAGAHPALSPQRRKHRVAQAALRIRSSPRAGAHGDRGAGERNKHDITGTR